MSSYHYVLSSCKLWFDLQFGLLTLVEKLRKTLEWDLTEFSLHCPQNKPLLSQHTSPSSRLWEEECHSSYAIRELAVSRIFPPFLACSDLAILHTYSQKCPKADKLFIGPKLDMLKDGEIQIILHSLIELPCGYDRNGLVFSFFTENLTPTFRLFAFIV